MLTTHATAIAVIELIRQPLLKFLPDAADNVTDPSTVQWHALLLERMHYRLADILCSQLGSTFLL